MPSSTACSPARSSPNVRSTIRNASRTSSTRALRPPRLSVPDCKTTKSRS
jgi:hypothetical protein